MLASADLDGDPIQSFNLEDEINKGWTGDVSFANKPSITMADMTVKTLTMIDRFGNTLESPPMLLRQRSKRFSMSQGWSGRFALMDLVSWKLSQGTLSFPTFLTADASDIIAAVATACDITATNAPDFPLWKEDFKQVDGWNVFRRIAIIAGMQLRITAEGVEFISQADTDGSWSLVCEDQEATNSPMDRYGRMFVGKNLGLGTLQPEQYYDFTEPGYLVNQPLITPLSSAFPYDNSANGYIGWVGFWDADDKLIAIYPMGGGEADGYTEPLDGVWPATKFSLWVYPQMTAPYSTNVRLKILGTPNVTIPAGIDHAIAGYYGSGRGYPQPFSDTMIPSADYAADHYLAWLKEINRHTFTIESNGPLQCFGGLLLPHTFDGHSGRVEKARWQGSSKGGASSFTTEVD